MTRTAAVIVAAGRGVRAGGAVPKQWQMLCGKPVLAHTLDAFQRHVGVGQIVLVLHPDDLGQADEFLNDDTQVVEGGANRAASVKNGLAAVSGADHVLIHDVARPLVTDALISDVIAALGTCPGAAPALAVTDALWTGAQDRVTGTQDRTDLFRAQTPQGFDLASIIAAHAAHPGGAADDVEVARAFGLDVAIVPGDEDNLKITVPADFARAERILRGRDGH
ncbi:2-C-methyl-D-erythritol 4-phosphate cytidylyltransferase [uncultured Tateyamaria sp.]|uniref:2-C-methyl-D-erythritol 4-phosphate cytidylyltransferase n=1 Tax=uncultured Tateyamaria sp. TaxID=455651 RepID=UPI0026311698|nr:2-C-methyl-D-erythritol 4-phosphate cytidylyltransferase [uncultured Tateyamaria sp.]